MDEAATVRPEVQAWLKRMARKGPFLLYQSQEASYDVLGERGFRMGWERYLIWTEGGKTKIGRVCDGMLTRYGIDTLAWVRTDDLDNTWRARPGAITPSMLAAMRKAAKGESDLAEFDLSTLKDVRP